MNLRCICWKFISALLLTCSLPAAVAAPDPTVAGYERWKADAEKRAEQKVAAEVAQREQAMELLAKPFKIGDQVTVSVTKGAVRQISGRFKGIEGGSAVIDDRRTLLSDISPVDADRLRYGMHPELLQLQLEKLRRELEQDKVRLRQHYLTQEAKTAGYTPQFFESSIELGGRYWSYADLGEGRMEATAAFTAGDAFVDVTVFNRAGVNSSALFLLGRSEKDQQAVACTIPVPVGVDAPVYQDASWTQHRFRLKVEDLGANPMDALGRDLRIWVVRNGVGSWQFQARRAEARSGRIFITFDMPRLRIKPHTESNRSNMVKLAMAAASYQKSIEERIAAADLITRKKMADDQAAAAAAAAASAARAAELAARQAARKSAEGRFTWVTQAEAKANPGDLTRLKISNAVFDSWLLPTTVTLRDRDYRITRMTEWLPSASNRTVVTTPPRDPTAVFEISGARFRLLRLMYPDVHQRKLEALKADAASSAAVPEQLALLLEEPDRADESDNRPDPGYLLQIRMAYDSPLSRNAEFIGTMALTLDGGSEIRWEEKFTVDPRFSGFVYSHHLLSISDLEKGIKGLSVAGAVTGTEAEKELIKKKLQEQLQSVGKPSATPGAGTLAAPGVKKPQPKLFD